MSFWEKFKEFDKMMSEPAFEIDVAWFTPDNNQMQQLAMHQGMQNLLEENKQLKKLIKNKRVNAIDVDHKLLE